MTMQRPPRLRAGDRIAAVSVSWGGPGLFPHRFEAGRRQLEDVFGVELVASEHALRDPEWLAAHPDARVAPVVTRMDFGHTDPMFVLPYGVRARVDPSAGTFDIVESAVI
ncbi:MAG: hypothetical protein U0Q11_24900 [Vicinamibacterales bacterium]